MIVGANYCYTGGKPFDPALPTVVFIHGALSDHAVWALPARRFAHRGYGVLAVDLPGHGRSQGAALTTVAAMAAWLVGLLDAAGVRQAVLVGHSMGSLIALETAFQSPARVAKLALLGTAYPMKVAAALLATADDDEPRAIDMVATWSHSAQAPSARRASMHVIDRSRRSMQRVAAIHPHRLLFTDLSACNDYANGEQAAASVACPTLFVVGTHDVMTPARTTTLLTTAIAHGTVVTVDAGHQMMAEAPDAVLAALLVFA